MQKTEEKKRESDERIREGRQRENVKSEVVGGDVKRGR